MNQFLKIFFVIVCISETHEISIFKPSKLTNIADFLNVFADCFINLINYQGLNINYMSSSFKVPLVLSRYKVFRKQNADKIVDTLIFLKHEVQNHSEFNVKTSQIDSLQRDFTTKNKNWVCTVSLFLYPFVVGNNNELTYWHHETKKLVLAVPKSYIQFGFSKKNFDQRTSFYFQKKPHQSYSILVVPPTEYTKDSIEAYMSPWKQLYSDLSNDYPENPLHNFRISVDLLVLETKVFELRSKLSAIETISTLLNGKIWYLCKYCDWCKIYTPVPINLNNAHNLHRIYLDTIISEYKISTALWKIYHPEPNSPWYKLPTRRFRDFSHFQMTFKRTEIDPDDTENALNYLHQALASTIFGNHSYTRPLLEEPRPCPTYLWQNKLLLPSIVYKQGSQTEFLVTEEFHPYKFVRCGGKRRLKHFSSLWLFQSGFDKWTWYFILFFYVVAIFMLNLFQGPFSMFLGSYAILIEQSQQSCTRL